MKRAGSFPRLFPGLLLVVAGAALLVASRGAWAEAQQLLTNPGFDDGAWPPASWNLPPGAVEHTDAPHAGVRAVEVELQADQKTVWQFVSGLGEGTITAGVYVRAAVGAADAKLRVEFLDAGFQSLGSAASATIALAGGFTLVNASDSAPAGTEFGRFEIILASTESASVVVDTATLSYTAAPTPTAEPTATPTSTEVPTVTNTPGATATNTSPSATNTPGNGGSPTSGPATPTPAATSQNTATPGAPPSATATPGSGASPGGPVPQPPSSGSPPQGGSPASPPADGSNLLANPGFELVSDGRPAGWANYGGKLYSVESPHSGRYSASLQSLTASTKWVHQVVRVEPGGWYSASAWTRRESGQAELFLRVSWYTSIDASGSLFAQVDSPVTTSASWAQLATGPIQAPSNARSARIRLMLRPNGPAAAAFDDATFEAATEPVPTATPTSPATPGSSAPAPPRTPVRPATSTATAVAGGNDSNVAGDRSGPSAAPGSRSIATVRLNEVASDPLETPDNAHEWVELYNAGTAPVDLGGWAIGDARSTDTLPSIRIEPGGYIVVAASGFEAPDGITVVRVSRIGSGLNNGGDSVVLMAPGGGIVDSMSYGEDASVNAEPPAAAGPGESLGWRDQPASLRGWQLTSRPTPGRANAFPEPDPEAGATETGPSATLELDVDESPIATEQPKDSSEPPAIRPGGDPSPIPWLVLGGTTGLGLAATAFLARKGAARYMEKRRGR